MNSSGMPAWCRRGLEPWAQSLGGEQHPPGRVWEGMYDDCSTVASWAPSISVNMLPLLICGAGGVLPLLDC
eukprot:353839-Chlamydomonas_euryale.AAC.33